ncbi:MAG: hypothetical protein ACTSPU_13290 [Promethearchaeota archaeon]
MKKISNSSSEEPNSRSTFEKGYMKVFTSSIVFLILGIILLSIGNLIITFADPQSSAAAEFLARTILTLSTFSKFFLQLGMVIFSLSTFLGAVRDTTLSGDVRKGMAAASAIGILALGIMMISIVSFPYYY